MEKKIRIALICFDNPFLKPMEGGKRAMLSKIRSLAMNENYEVDVYLHNKRAEGMAAEFHGLDARIRRFYQYRMNPGRRCLAGPWPICANKRFAAGCVEQLRKRRYDAAIYEGEQVAKYRLKNAVQADRHILYMHDIESAYRSEIARTHPKLPMRLANRLEALRFRRIERRIDEKFDRIWFISKDECAQFAEMIGKPEKCVYLPIPAMEIRERAARGSAENRMLYVGDMGILHNLLSVEWFAREVLPEIRRMQPGAVLTAVGRISDENAEKLRALGVDVRGYVDDLDALYEDAACIAAPVLAGAGVKVKIIDALGRGQIVATTSKGVEGTGLQKDRHLIVEDDPARLAEACARLLRDRSVCAHLAEAGLAFVRREHTVARQAEIMDQEIRRLLSGGPERN